MTIAEFLEQTIDQKLTLDEQKAYLGEKEVEDPKEFADAIRFLLARMPQAPVLPGAIDVVGTGGTGLDTINTSTLSSFTLASLGVKVGKHGNRSASGKFGSFDLLEALGVPIELNAEQLQARFNELNVAFLYAKSFHPIMRHFAAARAELGKPTFFNFLGPLLSPVNAQRQIIGVYDPSKLDLIAETARELGKEHVVVVHGEDGLDEITVCGETAVVELKDGKIHRFTLRPADFGITKTYKPSDIRGGGAEQNTAVAQAYFDGTPEPAHRDLILANTGMALVVAGRAKTPGDGYKLAEQAMLSKKPREILEAYAKPTILTTIADGRAHDESFRADFAENAARKKYAGGLIAEIKKASPSQGQIVEDVDVVAQAKLYESMGAKAISVVTEPDHFGGDLTDITRIKETGVTLPILCKDFVTSAEQINAIAANEADIVLLIASILDEPTFRELHKHAEALGLQVLCEVHNKAELDMVLKAQPSLVGVNARNLHDFSIDMSLFESLREHIPAHALAIAESGIHSFRDIPERADGYLVGTTIMKHPFPTLKLKELTGQPIIKLCGIRSESQAGLCEELEVDMIGINFVGRSRRKVRTDEAVKIRRACKSTIVVGVFENQTPKEVEAIARSAELDAIQLSGIEDVADYLHIAPILNTIRPGETYDGSAFIHILDNKLAGSGKQFDHSSLSPHEPALIAGGIDLDTAAELFHNLQPLGIDTASGIETDEMVDLDKIRAFAELASSTDYNG